jgi:hypothetical protein
MAAMLTCGDFRNEKRVGFFNQQACVATARTCSAKAGKAPQELRFRAAQDTRSGNPPGSRIRDAPT